MARYLITYLDGDSETVTAARIDPSGSQYIAWVGDGSAAAYIPVANVRSVVRQADEAGTYPHQDGDVTVLGPEIFASSDGAVICWKGENYIPQTATKAVTC